MIRYGAWESAEGVPEDSIMQRLNVVLVLETEGAERG
jgi:hypothetical protein